MTKLQQWKQTQIGPHPHSIIDINVKLHFGHVEQSEAAICVKQEDQKLPPKKRKHEHCRFSKRVAKDVVIHNIVFGKQLATLPKKEYCDMVNLLFSYFFVFAFDILHVLFLF